MKKIKKICILMFCIYMAICQINVKSLAYTSEEVKDIIEFKTVEEDGEPENPDIVIEAKDLQSNIKFPVIQADIDYLLYGDNDFTSINFFGLKATEPLRTLKYTNNPQKTKNEDRWKKISTIIKDFLRVSIYISAGILLTLLIYFAVVVVKGAISDNGIKMPGEALYSGEENYTKQLRDKKFVENWITSVFLLVFIVVIMNLIVAISSILGNTIIDAKGNGNYGLLTVYVKSDSNSEGKSGAETPDLPDDLENLQAKDLFSMGTIANEHTGQQEGQAAMDYIINTIASLANIAHSKYPMKRSIVIAQVINETGWIKTPDEGGEYDNPELVRDWNNVLGFNNYEQITSPETTWANKGYHNDWCWMPQDDGYHWENVKLFDNLYDCIEDWMGQFVYHHSAIDDYENYRSFLTGYTSASWVEKCKDMIERYNLERFDNMPDTPVGTSSSGATKSCYFKTNLEGLFMFESQYVWKGHILHNLMYIFGGLIISLFKWVLLGILIIRLFVVGVLTMIAPIMVMLDAYNKINGNKGVLKKWFILYLYFVLLKPLLSAVYFIMTKINSNFTTEHPFYILAVIIAMMVVAILSFMAVIRYISRK